MDAENLKLEKLTWSNYHLWKLKLEAVLEAKDIANYIENLPADEAQVKNDKKARAILRLSISDDVLPTIADCKTTKETWDSLAAHFNNTSGANQYFLLRRFYAIRKSKSESMASYITRVKIAVQELRGIGAKLEEAGIIAVVLGGLPKEYQNLVSNLESIKDVEISIVESRLLMEEKKESPNDTVALHSTSEKYAIFAERRVIIKKIASNSSERRRTMRKRYEKLIVICKIIVMLLW
jgi:hypothetical protein